jgi:hypothetical protein
VSRPKINVIGVLRFSAEQGLQFSIHAVVRGQGMTLWQEALPNTDNWPSLGPRPIRPERPNTNRPSRRESDAERQARWTVERAANDEWKRNEDEWKRASAAYTEALHSEQTYKQAATNFIELQRREPQEPPPPWDTGLWIYRDKVIRVESDEPETLSDKTRDMTLIKHFILRQERSYEKVKREVEALENMERLQGVGREPIPESVRLFVWQRDKGQCVKCGARERLEFDHIIPVVAGGSSTERNVQLLCEACNRSKGATV